VKKVVMWQYKAEWYTTVVLYKKGFSDAAAESWEPYLMSAGAGAVQVVYRRPAEVPGNLSKRR
jgi:hypothetical protein